MTFDPRTIPGAFQTGSSLITDDFQDIDVVVPESAWEPYRDDFFHDYTGNTYGVDGLDYTLAGTYRIGEYNVLVVYDFALPPWREATERLVANPEAYQDKVKRVVMYERTKMQYKSEMKL